MGLASSLPPRELPNWVRGLVLDRLRDLVPAAFHAYICTMRNELNRRDVLISSAAATAATVLPVASDAKLDELQQYEVDLWEGRI
jgi:mevalonate pyrophosphate decarboxylase